jgi:5-methylcytosine-specific restriction protein B
VTATEPPPRLGSKVRALNASQLGVAPPATSTSTPSPPPPSTAPPRRLDIEPLLPDDPVLTTIQDLLQTYGGVIFEGPPGTSKSWYAQRIGAMLADFDPARYRPVQFHPSYQYEDFMEGFVPSDDASGFKLVDKHFVEMCKEASGRPSNEFCVLVIDELSRGDPGRVFGEALTYVEKSKRGIDFRLASGHSCVVPENLVILATMNPLDRGVDEVDAALERRFAKYRMEPSDDLLSELLAEAGMDDELRERVLDFFRFVNGKSQVNPHASLGHTYFAGIADADGLHRLWEHQLRFHFDKAYRLDPDGLADLYARWDRVLAVASPAAPAASVNGDGQTNPETA